MSSNRVRATRLVPVGLAVGSVLAVSACGGSSGGGNLPNGADLLKKSSSAMSSVSSMSFSIATDGDTGLPIKGADGKLKTGAATGTVQLKQDGQVAQINFTVTGNSVYFKGPTGGYQKVPKALVIGNYVPSALLDPQHSIPTLLNDASNAKTLSKEKVGGAEAYKVQATLPKQAASALVPGINKDVTGDLWIDAKSNDLLKVEADDVGKSGTVTATFADFNGNFTITAPA